MHNSPVKWGILGTAQIAKVAVAPAIKVSRNSELYAVASRSKERLQDFAEHFGPARRFTNYEDLLADPEVEAVYIPLPNAMHAEWVLKALDAGKHVLCEKPLALSQKEASKISERAKQTRRHVMEGFMYRFHPRLKRVHQLLAEGAIGEVRAINASYAFKLSEAADVRSGSYEDDIRLKPELGGGALLDLGSYCVNGIRWYMKAEPESAVGWAHRPEPHGVEMRTAGLLDFGSGRFAQFVCAMDTFGGGHMEILGSKGKLTLPIAFRLRPTADPVPLVCETAEGINIEEYPYQDQYQAEIDEFVTSLRNDRAPAITLEDSVRNAQVLDALRRSWEDGEVKL